MAGEVLFDMKSWCDANGVNATTQEKLREQEILTIYDLLLLTESDVRELNFTIGSRNRLLQALKSVRPNGGRQTPGVKDQMARIPLCEDDGEMTNASSGHKAKSVNLPSPPESFVPGSEGTESVKPDSLAQKQLHVAAVEDAACRLSLHERGSSIPTPVQSLSEIRNHLDEEPIGDPSFNLQDLESPISNNVNSLKTSVAKPVCDIVAVKAEVKANDSETDDNAIALIVELLTFMQEMNDFTLDKQRQMQHIVKTCEDLEAYCLLVKELDDCVKVSSAHVIKVMINMGLTKLRKARDMTEYNAARNEFLIELKDKINTDVLETIGEIEHCGSRSNYKDILSRWDTKKLVKKRIESMHDDILQMFQTESAKILEERVLIE